MKKQDDFARVPGMRAGLVSFDFRHPHRALDRTKPRANDTFTGKKFTIGYLVAVHLLLGVLLLSNQFPWLAGGETDAARLLRAESEYFQRVLRYHERMDGNVPDGAVVFIGDSITQGLCVSAVAPLSVNYGIGGDTTVGVLQRLPTYQSLWRAGAIVVAIGNNDLKFRTNKEIVLNYAAILERLPRDVTVIFSAPFPYDEKANVVWSGRNQRIKAISKELAALTGKAGNLHFIDAGPQLVDAEGNLADSFHDGDGTHLNEKGNAVWIRELKRALQSAGGQTTASRD